MNIQLKNEIFNKFRNQLPTNINDNVIKTIVNESCERVENVLRDETLEFLLEDKVVIEIDDEFYEGDIVLYSNEQYGINWIFDSETGELHTT